MRVFITGASGFIGSAIVKEFLGAGHEVLGLVRSEASAQALLTTGAQAHFGSLDDLESLRRGAAAADGVIHTAFNHDFEQYEAASQTDVRAIQAIAEALLGTDRKFVVTAGLGGFAARRIATELDTPREGPRHSESTALGLAADGIHASVVRLAPSVHGAGDQAFVPTLIRIARETGVAAYVEDGVNRWAAVHRLDAARLYRLVLEQGKTGTCYHGAADAGIPMRELASLIGRKLNLPVVSISADDAARHFGWMARFVGMDIHASSALTQQWLGWKPEQLGLIADLDSGHYFE